MRSHLQGNTRDRCYNSCAASACRNLLLRHHGPFALAVGEWLSLVEHLVRDQGVGGSNPLSPTILSRSFSATTSS
jgi:hypothetical protein